MQMRIIQDQETPITTQIGDSFSYRYAFERSADSILANAPGQDYLAIDADEAHLAFVLCDGVSQSFYGDLAARFLGDQLVHWLWEKGSKLINHPDDIQLVISTFLNTIKETASRQVSEFLLPEMIAPMLKGVLEKKRALGSEAIFTAGFLDLVAGQAVLCWMGDARLRIWGASGEISNQHLDKHTFLTQERWSTKRGVVGELHTAFLSLAELVRIVSYSDGLARLDQKITKGSPSNRTLANIIQENKYLPTSDDISFLEIWLGEKPSAKVSQPKPPAELKVDLDDTSRQLSVSWRSVRKATSYEVVIQSERGWKLFSSVEPCWTVMFDELPPEVEQVAVRVWVNEEASEWCNPCQVKLKPDTQSERLSEALVSFPQLQIEPGSSSNLLGTRSLKTSITKKDRPPQKFLFLGYVIFVIIITVFYLANLYLGSGPGSDVPNTTPGLDALTTFPAMSTPTATPDTKGGVLWQLRLIE